MFTFILTIESQFTRLTSILFSFHGAFFIENHSSRAYCKSHFTAPKSSISHFTRTDIDQSRLAKIPFTTLILISRHASRQLQKIQNRTNSENRHLVFSLFKKQQENNGVGDISSIFESTMAILRRTLPNVSCNLNSGILRFMRWRF